MLHLYTVLHICFYTCFYATFRLSSLIVEMEESMYSFNLRNREAQMVSLGSQRKPLLLQFVAPTPYESETHMNAIDTLAWLAIVPCSRDEILVRRGRPPPSLSSC